MDGSKERRLLIYKEDGSVTLIPQERPNLEFWIVPFASVSRLEYSRDWTSFGTSCVGKRPEISANS